eukprot:1999908-Prorocentrum_lima.AAC.1
MVRGQRVEGYAGATENVELFRNLAKKIYPDTLEVDRKRGVMELFSSGKSDHMIDQIFHGVWQALH